MRRLLWLPALLLPLIASLAVPAQGDAPTGDQTVPDLVGLAQAQAAALATQAGFEMQVTLDPAGPRGVVFSQEPGGLALRAAGTVIVVKVGGEPAAAPPAPAPAPAPEPPPAEPPPTEVPPTQVPPTQAPTGEPPAGEPPAVPVPEPGPGPTAPAPAPEELAPPPGDLASLPGEEGVNTDGPVLPVTYGLARQEAEAKLAGWHVVAEVTLAGPEFEGRVLEQHPEPTTHLAHGEVVTLIFGLAAHPGADYRQVPPLEGLTQTEATARLASAGFVPVWCTVPSTEDRVGKVMSHSPRRHSFLLRGEGVRVRLGRGGVASPVTPAPVEPTPSEPPPPPPPPAEPPPAEPTPVEPTPPAEPTPPSGTLPPAEPLPEPPTPAPAEPPPAEPPPAEPAPAEPPPAEPPPAEPPPAEPPPEEPAPPPPPPVEPTPMPFPAQPPRTAPGPVALVGPPDEDSRPRAFGATFEWRTVTNADAYEFVLEQEVQGGWQVVRTDNLIGVKFRPASLAVGRYRWRVRALSGDLPGAWSDYRRVYLY